MDEYSWSSRSHIFYRIRVSKHDLGSSLDREGQFTMFIRRSLEAHEQISDSSFLHNRVASSPLAPERQSAYLLAL